MSWVTDLPVCSSALLLLLLSCILIFSFSSMYRLADCGRGGRAGGGIVRGAERQRDDQSRGRGVAREGWTGSDVGGLVVSGRDKLIASRTCDHPLSLVGHHPSCISAYYAACCRGRGCARRR